MRRYKQIRFRILVAYDGSAYNGWQIQSNARSVEGELTKAAMRVLNCGADEVKIQGASRTDAGVHALGQVAHIAYDLDKNLTAWDFVRGLNALTDDDICVVFGILPRPAFTRATRPAERSTTTISGITASSIRCCASASGRPAASSTWTRCARPPRSWSVSTTSPRFAPGIARPRRRCARCSASRSSTTARTCAWRSRAAHS